MIDAYDYFDELHFSDDFSLSLMSIDVASMGPAIS